MDYRPRIMQIINIILITICCVDDVCNQGIKIYFEPRGFDDVETFLLPFILSYRTTRNIDSRSLRTRKSSQLRIDEVSPNRYFPQLQANFDLFRFTPQEN